MKQLDFVFEGRGYSSLKELLELELPGILSAMDTEGKIEFINDIREIIHNNSPLKNEPVDFVKWVKTDNVIANDYNPNSVAPPEMQLLEVSINHDGYTQPIVTWPKDNEIEVIDGFHRNRVGRESEIINKRIFGHLPTVIIKKEREGKNDRMASTIRHNRARGKHAVNAMSDIVIELKRRNWSESRISKELGMDEDEILRLCQISGLAEAFENDDFSMSWEAEMFSDEINPDDVEFEDEEA